MEPALVFNVEEFIDKTVQNSSGDIWELLAELERKTPRKYVCPKGVYRFHSHEEADAWLEKYTRPVTSNQ